MKNKMLRAASLLLALLMLCTMFVFSAAAEETSTGETTSDSGTVGTDAADQEASQPEKTQTTTTAPAVDDLSITDVYNVYCENENFALSFSEEGMFLKLTDKRSGKEWYSTPPGVWSSMPAINKPERMSLITVTYVDKSGNENYAYSYTKSVNKDGAKMTPIKEDGKVVGARIDFSFVSECFDVPVEIRLTENGLDFSVLYDEISVRPFSNLGISYRVTKVAIMPFFGSSDKSNEGYLVVPDGCGALIDFQKDNGSVICDYTQVMYGRDASKAIKAKTAFKERLMLPMYGVKNGNGGFTAIVTSGDSRTELFYRVEGIKSAYNNIYFNFIYCDNDLVTAKTKSWDAKTFKVFEEYALSGEAYTVSYRFTEEAKSDYVGMAELYREYLVEEKGMKVTAQADYAPLNVELIGSIRRPISILGFPVNSVVALTSYDDVLTMNDTLKDMGVSQILFDYKNWYAGSADQKIPADVSTEGALGSQNTLRDVTAALKEDGTKIFANLDFVNLRTTGNGFNKKGSATRSMDKQPAMLYQFNAATYQSYSTETELRKVTYMLSPLHFEEATKRAVASMKNKNFGFTGISDSNLCATTYSDYGKQEYERNEANAAVQAALQNLSEATGELMLNSANGYTLPYATYVGSAPIQNSNYYTFTSTIPLYQLVIQGVVNNATTIMNEEADVNQAVLKAVETGSALKVRWLNQNMKMVDQTMFDYLMNSDFSLWVDDVADMYSEVAPFLRSVSDQSIVAHSYVEENVTKTTFANGITVVVNYNYYDVTVDGEVVEARSFAEGRV